MAREHIKTAINTLDYLFKTGEDIIFECIPDCPACIEQATARAIKEAGEKPCPHVHLAFSNRPAWACEICREAVFKEYGV